MECPHCAETLRVIDRQPAPPGTFIRIACPARKCGKEIVALVGEESALAPMTRGEVRVHATRIVFHALRADFTFPLAGVIGTALLTTFLAIWQILIPSEHDNWRGVIAIVVGGAAIVLVFGMSIVVDLAIGVRGWRDALPRPLIDVKTMPTDYRT